MAIGVTVLTGPLGAMAAGALIGGSVSGLWGAATGGGESGFLSGVVGGSISGALSGWGGFYAAKLGASGLSYAASMAGGFLGSMAGTATGMLLNPCKSGHPTAQIVSAGAFGLAGGFAGSMFSSYIGGISSSLNSGWGATPAPTTGFATTTFYQNMSLAVKPSILTSIAFSAPKTILNTLFGFSL